MADEMGDLEDGEWGGGGGGGQRPSKVMADVEIGSLARREEERGRRVGG